MKERLLEYTLRRTRLQNLPPLKTRLFVVVRGRIKYVAQQNSKLRIAIHFCSDEIVKWNTVVSGRIKIQLKIHSIDWRCVVSRDTREPADLLVSRYMTLNDRC